MTQFKRAPRPEPVVTVKKTGIERPAGSQPDRKPMAPSAFGGGGGGQRTGRSAPYDASGPSDRGYRSDRTDRADRPGRADRPAAAPARGYGAPDRPMRPAPERFAPAPVQPLPANAMRLNKRMAELGMCSRREGDDWIARGWVKVNGQVAELGQMVTPDDAITTQQHARDAQEEKVTILLHKPMGYVSGQAEDGHEPAVVLIDSASRWRQDKSPRRFHWGQRTSLAPAGRLDIDSTGLLVLTQDGRVARQIIGETSHLEKEYLVRVSMVAGEMGQPSVNENVQAHFPVDQLALLRHGLSLDGHALKPAQVEWQNPEQLRFVLTEGKKRQIRRMCELVGLHVVGLKRVRIGRIMLGNLPAGQWRYLAENETF